MRSASFIIALSLFAAVTACGQKAPIDTAGNPCLDGEAALAADDPERAVTSFEACLESRELEPGEEAIIHSQLGGAYLYLDRYEDALREFDLAYAVAETQGATLNSPYVRRNRGIARYRTDRKDGALSDLEAAAIDLPNDMLTFLNLGGLYLDLDRPAEAVAAFDTVTRLEPTWPGGWISRSGAFLELGINTSAIDDARRAVELDPESGFALNQLCWSLIEDGRAEAALPLCEQAVAAEPEIGAIVHSLASALEDVGREEEAYPLFAQAHELTPDDPELLADYERTHPNR
jgi:tetratricopeptide (TPR) repeat protein